MCRYIVVTAALALFAAPGRAQDDIASGPTAVLTPGARVRVTAPGLYPEPRVGTVAGLADDSLYLTPDKYESEYIAVPLDGITLLEVSSGYSNLALPGTVLGLAVGGAIGIAIASSGDDGTGRPLGGAIGVELSEEAGKDIAIFMGGLFVGGLLGNVLGRAVSWDRWAPVAVQRAVSPAVGYDGRSFRAALTIRF